MDDGIRPERMSTTGAELRRSINQHTLAQMLRHPADDGDDGMEDENGGGASDVVGKRAHPPEVRLTLSSLGTSAPAASAMDLEQTDGTMVQRRKGSVAFAGAPFAGSTGTTQRAPSTPWAEPEQAAMRLGALGPRAEGMLAEMRSAESVTNGRRSYTTVSLWWRMYLERRGRHALLAVFGAPALVGIGACLAIGFTPYSGLGGYSTRELRRPAPLGATLNFFLTAGAYAPLLVSCLFTFLLLETSEFAQSHLDPSASGAGVHEQAALARRVAKLARGASLGEVGLWLVTFCYYGAWMIVSAYAHAPTNPLLGIFRTTSIVMAMLLFVVGLTLFTLMVHILRSFVLRDRQAKASKYVLNRVLPHVRVTVMLQLFCCVFMWASAINSPLLFHPVAFGSGDDTVPPCANITTRYVADRCALAGGGRYRCTDDGWLDYSSLMVACDAATEAPAFYVRGASIVGINYNLVFLLISLEFFASGVLDSESMRPIAGLTVASLSGSALCLVFLVAFALLPSPAISHTNILSMLFVINVTCWIVSSLLLTFGASAELALGARRRKRTCDVFLSYRVATDAALVERLYDKLCARGLTVWWDRECLEKGRPFWDCIIDGLRSAHVFVPIVSRGVLDGLSALDEASKIDGVLIEYRAVHELLLAAESDGRGTGGASLAVFPLLVGDVKSLNITMGATALQTMFRFYDALSFPTLPRVRVKSVEDMIDKYDLRYAPTDAASSSSPVGSFTSSEKHEASPVPARRGSVIARVLDRIVHHETNEQPSKPHAPMEDLTTVAGSVTRVLAFQGHVFKGMEDEAINNAVKSIVDCVLAERGRKVADAGSGARVTRRGSHGAWLSGALTRRGSSRPRAWARDEPGLQQV